MSTITVQGHIHFKHEDYSDHDYRFWPYEDMKSSGHVYVCPHKMTFEVPDGWNPIPGQVAALEAKRTEVQKEFMRTIARINAEIGKLQAIEFEPAEAAP